MTCLYADASNGGPSSAIGWGLEKITISLYNPDRWYISVCGNVWFLCSWHISVHGGDCTHVSWQQKKVLVGALPIIKKSFFHPVRLKDCSFLSWIFSEEIKVWFVQLLSVDVVWMHSFWDLQKGAYQYVILRKVLANLKHDSFWIS